MQLFRPPMATCFDIPKHSSIVNECKSTHAGKHVSGVIISGNPISTIEAPDITYHYRMFLVVQGDSDPDYSIRLDMQPDTSNKNIGILTLTSLDYLLSNNPRAINFSATVSEGATVAAFVNHWMKLKRNQYQFNELAEGCRFWCKTLLGDAETQGLVTSGSLGKFGQWEELMNKIKGPGRVPIPVARGTFI
ncbi:hypothetical protein AGABI1DRAFT_92703 [Agaricus bisporus var. burnettii JB137-S8]|uniref:DUF7770 domain-containing protein n=1 Tax=Agaricus bisporus var. burnettii (strain JB137-S8 / ATCC MYA-4627 / FGSC 10392) TaxID=597362 RepID=K5X5C5_AGABU|nr:uncharacterized protein AGABI1DRAFT_92703 [Agaricus bisporus var. burnettii JB137-S8]EKM78393.1 hypothetical protein AGABI1DRAFT_92703 [Agaricus bisporus var. burnettii JB137-S8]